MKTIINKHAWRRIAVWLLSSFFVLPSAYSQELPSAGQELRRQQQQELFNTLPTRIPETEKPAEEKKQKLTKESVVFIKDFVFTGEITVFNKQEIYAFVSEHIGKKMALSELLSVIDQITQYYRDKGYMLAKALLPPQDITDGIMTINIQEGRLDKGQGGVKINSQDIRLNTDFASKLFAHAVKPGSVIHNEKLERGVLLLNDLPGVNASVNLEPGSEAGTTRIVLDVKEDPLIRPRITWDNSGSRLTGAYKGGFTVDVNDLTGYGDQLSTTYQGSLDGGAFHYIRTTGKMPIGYSGFKLGTSFQYLAYETGKEFENLDAKGDAFQWGIDGEYPIIRSRKTNLWIKAGFVQKILQDEALGESTSHKFLNIGSLGLTATYADSFLGGGFTQGSITGYYGNNDLSGLNSFYQSDQSAVGARTDGNFAKGFFNARRIQRVAENLILISNFSGQLASKNLSSVEKFQLGGVSGVRAYPSGEGTGDHGALINIDGIYTLFNGTPLGNVDLVAFYDWGRVQQFDNADNLIITTPNNYNLSGYGFSLKVGKPGRFNVDLTVARRIGNNPGKNPLSGRDSDGSLDETRFWFNTSLAF